MADAELSGRYDGLVPLIPIRLPQGTLEVILDTGFEGALMLPAAEFDKLEEVDTLSFEVTTATGWKETCRGARIVIPWLGQNREVDAIETPAPFALAGMDLLKHAETLLRPADGVLRIRRIG